MRIYAEMKAKKEEREKKKLEKMRTLGIDFVKAERKRKLVKKFKASFLVFPLSIDFSLF